MDHSGFCLVDDKAGIDVELNGADAVLIASYDKDASGSIGLHSGASSAHSSGALNIATGNSNVQLAFDADLVTNHFEECSKNCLVSRVANKLLAGIKYTEVRIKLLKIKEVESSLEKIVKFRLCCSSC